MPPQTSAPVAYLYAAVATALPVAAGVLLLQSDGPSGTAGRVSAGDIGVTLVIAGAWFGPLAGNLSLGAGRDARAGVLLTATGFVSGVVLAGAGVAVGGTCVVADLARNEVGSADCPAGTLSTALLVGGLAGRGRAPWRGPGTP